MTDRTPLLPGAAEDSTPAGQASACALTEACFLADGSRKDSTQHRKVQRKLLIACILCFIFMGVEVVGGLMAHSIAVLSDAAHMLSDVAGFAVSLFAAWAVTRKSHQAYSFGYHRVEILGALVSVITIWAVTGALVFEAVNRLLRPEPVNGKVMFIVASAGVVFNVIIAIVLGEHHVHGVGGQCSHSHGHGEPNSHGAGHSHDHGPGHGSSQPHDADGHAHDNCCIITVPLAEPAAGEAVGVDIQDALHAAALPAILPVLPKHSARKHIQKHKGTAHGSGAAAGNSSSSGDEGHGHAHGAAGGGCCGHGHGHGHAAAEQHGSGHGNHSHDDDDHDDDGGGGGHSHVHAQQGAPAAAPAGGGGCSSTGGGDAAGSGPDGHTHKAHSHGHGCGGHAHGHGHSHGGGSSAAAGGHSHGHAHAHGAACSGHSHGGHAHEGGHGHGHGHAPSQDNINLRSAVLHVIGDLLQSIGVAIAGALIWWKQDDPRWQVADPICTFLFAILVLITTGSIIQDIMHTLMERTPQHVNLGNISEAMSVVEGVLDVHDLHVWNLSVGLPILTAHVHIGSQADANEVLAGLEAYVRGLGIRHSTIQICNPQGKAIAVASS